MQVEFLELELTTNCNAACPQCSRNFYGGPRWPSLPIASMSLPWLKEKLPLDFMSKIKVIRLCGTYGDPCVHPDIVLIVEWLKSVTTAGITINTNGGMRKPAFWQKLAQSLGPNDKVVFGIDGLEDTNHLYRRGVSWKRLIENVKAFNDAGGNSVWQFLPFEHNEHQVDAAKQMAKNLGFSDFLLKRTTRFVDKKHERVARTTVVDTNKIYFISPPNKKELINPGYINFDKSSYATVPIDCIANQFKMIYIGADGYVFHCGFLSDRLYGYEAEQHHEFEKFKKLMDLAGGPEKANLNFTPLDEIVDGAWFKVIEDSWNNENRLERCAHQCGKHNGLGESTFTYIKEK